MRLLLVLSATDATKHAIQMTNVRKRNTFGVLASEG